MSTEKFLQSLSIEDAEEQIYKARQQLVPYKIKRIIVDENYNDMSKLPKNVNIKEVFKAQQELADIIVEVYEAYWENVKDYKPRQLSVESINTILDLCIKGYNIPSPGFYIDKDQPSFIRINDYTKIPKDFNLIDKSKIIELFDIYTLKS